MSTTSKDFYGWDLLYKTIEGVVNKKDDLIIALAHFILTKHSQFKCIGIGDDKTLSEDEEDNGSELLPNNWNDDDNNYALRYTHDKRLYILLGLRTEGSLIITLLDVNTRKVSNISLDPEVLVKETKGSLKIMIPNAAQLADRFRKELLEPVYAATSKTVTTQTAGVPQTSPTCLHRDVPRVARFSVHHIPSQRPPPFVFPIGSGDLDPLGGDGSGNLFPFPYHPLYPRADIGIGPGARPRFDPYGPPERSIRPNPNPDHMPPPGFGDDYYM